MYKYTLCNTPYIHLSVTTMYIGYPMYIQREECNTMYIPKMYINMLPNVYRKCIPMYPSTMLPNLHLRCISKCNQMYIPCNPMYIPLFLLVSECIGWDIHCVAFYIHWGYTL